MFVILKSIDNINIVKFINKIIIYYNDKDQNGRSLKFLENFFFHNHLQFNNANNVASKIKNEIAIHDKIYGITQDPKTMNYMMVLNTICKKCKSVCNAIYQQNPNWTSGDDIIDKYIQDTQLSKHNSYFEWIPYDRFYGVKYTAKGELDKAYIANWIDGYIDKWDNSTKNWKRKGQNMFVILKTRDSLNIEISTYYRNRNTSTICISTKSSFDNAASKINNEVEMHHQIYGMTQDPETKNYMVVLNARYNFLKSLNDPKNISLKSIEEIAAPYKLSAHYDVSKSLEWISYSRFCNVKYIAKNDFGEAYRANWIDGYIHKWNNEYQNWNRKDQNMLVALKSLIDLEKYIEKYKVYGITQDPKTKNYMMLSAHTAYGARNALEWIPYDRFHGIKYIAKGGFGKVYGANLVDGYIGEWNENRKRSEHKFVALKILNNSQNISLDFVNEITLHHQVNNNVNVIKLYGITQDPETKHYIMVLEYASKGSLRNYLDTNYNTLSWKDKLLHFCHIASGLVDIHRNELIHRDFHIGNVLVSNFVKIADLGLSSLRISYKTHSDAIYTSRLLNFNNLPEQKNSDDYYEQNDNIISNEFLESLQIDISQLNIDDSDKLSKPKNSDDYEQNDDNMISKEDLESLQIDISQLNDLTKTGNLKAKIKSRIKAVIK
ncbi:kinase-like domain-containing protein [Rhizophagus irregularis DAOM 181602=DAOM 197198]|nr:kinase-like domain-containing protein [Rhizophagus irregularis DAOM 181602=DAOM 197198]